ncbi:hypothetical protein [Nocardia farcinica]|uniref:hypothetical protein n=1 Tax=Nocardia farcinica TaxID=37329 RepID=UPI000E08320D|nr:hypothetical protein [Nocardia farcinica]MBF6250163.1 hypothetical protein [Nocardia farcinica]MBF6445505.1 hypothetical protein [Nocardia farcinica]MBF6523328.1 hypothetical protein [Nocardia farcinica]SUE27758.1 Uncharacterised protein [Nocardia farcinica]
MPDNRPVDDERDYFDMHYTRRRFMRPGEPADSPVWNSYLKPLVDPFVEVGYLHYTNEEELHQIIWAVWKNAGVDNDATVEHELWLPRHERSPKGSRIDFLWSYDDGHRAGVEIKAAGWWSTEAVQEQLVRYAETEHTHSMLLLTADYDHLEVDWPTELQVPLFIVLIDGCRGRR